MSSIILKGRFGGILPRFDAKKLPPEAAQTAQNVDLLAARLDPIKGLGSSVGSVTSGDSTIFKWYRNSSSEWLSEPEVESFEVGPIKNDSYSRAYYTDSGVLSMYAWSSSKINRTVGLTAPSAAPTITTTPENYFRYDPSTLTLDVRQTLSSVALSDSDTIDETAIPVWRYTNRTDGKTDVYFKISRQSFDLSNASSQNNPDFVRDVFYRLILAAPESASIPTSLGGNIFGKTVELTASAVKYGQMQVERIKETGFNVNWSIIWDNAPAITGTPASAEANPQTTEYTVKLTLDMNYIGAAGTSLGEQYAYYVQTYVDDLGEESPPSAVSDMVSFFAGQKITVGLGSDPGGVITLRRLYRSAAGTTKDGFYFVAEIAAATTTYADTKADAELGELIPLFENPPTNLTGIALLPNGYFVGWQGKDLYYTEPWHPYSWPTTYRLSTQYDIIGVGVTNNEHVVLTKGNPYIVYGTDPSIQTIQEIPHPQACSNADSIAVVKSSVFYVSPDGLNEVKHGVGRLLTEGFYKPADWKALTPSSAVAAVQDKKYLVWMTGAKLIFDMDEGIGAVVSHNITLGALYHDIVDDILYGVVGTGILPWAGGTDQTYTWRSKEFQHTRNWAPTCGRVVADSYPLTIKLYADNALVDTTSVTSEEAFNFPPLVRTRVWSVQVEHNGSIDEIRVATSKRELGA